MKYILGLILMGLLGSAQADTYVVALINNGTAIIPCVHIIPLEGEETSTLIEAQNILKGFKSQGIECSALRTVDDFFGFYCTFRPKVNSVFVVTSTLESCKYFRAQMGRYARNNNLLTES